MPCNLPSTSLRAQRLVPLVEIAAKSPRHSCRCHYSSRPILSRHLTKRLVATLHSLGIFPQKGPSKAEPMDRNADATSTGATEASFDPWSLDAVQETA